jgi:uncharacterized membrane protein
VSWDIGTIGWIVAAIVSLVGLVWREIAKSTHAKSLVEAETRGRVQEAQVQIASTNAAKAVIAEAVAINERAASASEAAIIEAITDEEVTPVERDRYTKPPPGFE